MVKSKKMLGLAMLVIIPLAASVGQGSMCYVDVSVGSLAVPGDLIDIYSYSYGYAEDGLGNSSVASDPQYAFGSVADAAGLLPQARAKALTVAGYAGATAYASMAGDVTSRAYANAQQFWLLDVAGTGHREFTAPISIDWDLESGVGDEAYGDTYLSLFLFDDADQVLTEAPISTSWYVADGSFDSSGSPWTDSLTLAYDFTSPGQYTVMLYADVQAVAAPLPGAVLLGSLGISFAGWLLRRRGTSKLA
jgi:hypothetical protein